MRPPAACTAPEPRLLGPGGRPVWRIGGAVGLQPRLAHCTAFLAFSGGRRPSPAAARRSPTDRPAVACVSSPPACSAAAGGKRKQRDEFFDEDEQEEFFNAGSGEEGGASEEEEASSDDEETAEEKRLRLGESFSWRPLLLLHVAHNRLLLQ